MSEDIEVLRESMREWIESTALDISCELNDSASYGVTVSCEYADDGFYEWRVIRQPLTAPELVAGGVTETYESAFKSGWDEVARIEEST